MSRSVIPYAITRSKWFTEIWILKGFLPYWANWENWQNYFESQHLPRSFIVTMLFFNNSLTGYGESVLIFQDLFYSLHSTKLKGAWWSFFTCVICFVQCTPDISRSCISRNWIYHGRMLDPIFWRPRMRYFSRNRGHSLDPIHGSIDTSIVSQRSVLLIQCQCKSRLQIANLGINNAFLIKSSLFNHAVYIRHLVQTLGQFRSESGVRDW